MARKDTELRSLKFMGKLTIKIAKGANKGGKGGASSSGQQFVPHYPPQDDNWAWQGPPKKFKGQKGNGSGRGKGGFFQQQKEIRTKAKVAEEANAALQHKA